MTKRNLEREQQILRLLHQGWGPARVGRYFKISTERVCYIRDRAKCERSTGFPMITVKEG